GGPFDRARAGLSAVAHSGCGVADSVAHSVGMEPPYALDRPPTRGCRLARQRSTRSASGLELCPFLRPRRLAPLTTLPRFATNRKTLDMPVIKSPGEPLNPVEISEISRA